MKDEPPKQKSPVRRVKEEMDKDKKNCKKKMDKKKSHWYDV